ncbi:transglutaminase [Trypanosoma theileri]|uniref:Transglutaminase n=1 Tax=Trypanosoma theileri TaxID=67003 RepID=A0A1X0NF38_9TRYP|nr:transglutaminase [Trypanosoma theileri]ORC82115.1 transglutaminase [Trypanosoma theileri]
MTTMFVQLRRVVYLLVLLQCCTCLAPVEASGDMGDVHDEPKKVGEEKWQEGLEMLVDSAYVMFVQGRGCLTVWKEVAVECNKSTKGLPTVVKGIEGPVKELEGIKVFVVSPVEAKKVDGVVERIFTAVQATVDAAYGTVVSEKVTWWVARNCLTTKENWEGEKQRFASIKDHFADALGKTLNETMERLTLVKNSSKIYEEMGFLEGNLTAYNWESNYMLGKTLEEVKAAKQKIDAAYTELKRIEDHKEETAEEYTAIKRKIAEFKDKVKGKFDEVEKLARRTPLRRNLGDTKQAVEEKLKKARDGAAREGAETVKEEVKKMVEEELAQREREAEERRVQEQAQREREAEEKRVQEQAQREREAEEKRAKEQAQREREAEEKRAKEQAQREREAEEKRAKEQAQRDRVAQEKKEKEEQQKRAADEEKVRQAKEEAMKKAEKIKKNDSSPVLVRSPLMLLLFLIGALGCNFVC